MTADLAPDAAAALAARHCGDCGWYHGFWPLVRALGCGTEPGDHAAFYAAALPQAAAGGPLSRILICGSADAAMPRLAARLVGALGALPRITVLDRCATPLEICRAVMTPAEGLVDTVRGDARDAPLEPGFDLILTHSFLGYFDEEGRGRLMARWHALLRPGGRVLTVNRLRPGAPETVAFSAEQTDAFVARLLERLAGNPGITTMTPAAVAGRARDYAERFRIRPVRAIDDVRALAHQAGLTAEATPLGILGRGGPSGPTAPGAADYVGFTLGRPA